MKSRMTIFSDTHVRGTQCENVLKNIQREALLLFLLL